MTTSDTVTEAPAADRTPTRREQWSALVPLGIGLAGCVGSLRLSLGTPSTPQPGFWPFLVSAVLLACAIVLLLRAPDGGDEPFTRETRTALVGVATLAIFVGLFLILGFLLPAIALLTCWLRFLGREPWRTTLLVAVLTPAALYVVFGSFLGVPFPPDAALLFTR